MREKKVTDSQAEKHGTCKIAILRMMRHLVGNHCIVGDL